MSNQLELPALQATGSHSQQRVLTQAGRRQWDAEWISEQRAAVSVVRQRASERMSAEVRLLTPEGAGVAETQPERPGAAAKADTASPRLADERAAAWNRQSPVSHGKAESDPRTIEVPVLARPEAVTANESPLQARDAGRAQPASRTPRQLALWRTDDSVRVAMRLRDPERSLHEVIGALRGWLKQAGLSLTGLIVNGRVQSLPESGEATGKQAILTNLSMKI